MVVVETVRGVTTRVRFLPLILTSLGSKEWNALLAESLKRCQHYFDALTTNPLLLELNASTSGKDVPTFEGPQHLLRKLVDFDYNRSGALVTTMLRNLRRAKI